MQGSIYIDVFLFFLAGTLHTIGFALLQKVKPKPENQRRILLHFSCVEILFAFWTIPYILHIPRSDSSNLFYDWLWASLVAVLQMLLMFLMLDKTASIYFHLKYPLIFTEKRIRGLLISFWVFGGTFGVLIVLLECYAFPRKIVQTCWKKSYIAVNVIILAFGIGHFAYLFSKVKQIRRSDKDISVNATNVPTIAKFWLPTFIVATFVIIGVPMLAMFLLANYYKSYLFRRLAHFLEAILFISEALAYIFLLKPIRTYLKRLFTRKRISPE